MEGKKTPLYEKHLKYGGRIVDFEGWLLPVQFTGILEEHRAVRSRAGLFDVSHMGEIAVTGEEAFAFLQYLATNNLEGMYPGRIRYSPLCYENGGTVDDILIYMLDENRFMLVVNAANTEKDYEWIGKKAVKFKCRIEDVSMRYAQIALQGPLSVKVLAAMIDIDLSAVKYYTFVDNVKVGKWKVLLSRTGYTGEDGFELYCTPSEAGLIWESIMEEGKNYGLALCGLGARDTLRLEAGMPLYGHELSAEISPLEAGLERYVCFEKEMFIGRTALLEQDRKELKRKIIGLEMLEKGIPRHGYRVWRHDKMIGSVTSGTYSPSLDKNIALVLLDREFAEPGLEVEVEIRGRKLKAKTTAKVFYKRGQ